MEISIPYGFTVECEGDKLKSISLPGSLTCISPSETNDKVRLTMNETLVPGDYAFAVEGIPPKRTPPNNAFSLVLKDRFGQVRDAAMNIDGWNIHTKLQMRAAPLAWSQSGSGTLSVITLGFDLLDELPDNPPLILSEVLITFPQGFVHAIETSRDFESLNEEFPIDRGNPNWLDYTQMDRIRVRLALDVDFKTGEYRFNFPVYVPQQMPPYNVWMTSMCKEGAGGCKTPSDSSVVVTFPVAGFKIGQPHPSMAKKRIGSGAVRRSRPSPRQGELLFTIALLAMSRLAWVRAPS